MCPLSTSVVATFYGAVVTLANASEAARPPAKPPATPACPAMRRVLEKRDKSHRSLIKFCAAANPRKTHQALEQTLANLRSPCGEVLPPLKLDSHSAATHPGPENSSTFARSGPGNTSATAYAWIRPQAQHGEAINSKTRATVSKHLEYLSSSISGLVVEYIVAIDLTWVRFLADASLSSTAAA